MNKTFGILLFSLLFNLGLSGQISDEFARIGNKAAFYRIGELEEQLPQDLENIQLPLETGPAYGFPPMDIIDTPGELDLELKRMRKRYAVFMSDLAPERQSQRIRLALDSFQWRIQTEADRTGFPGVLSGTGCWDRVSIPHFGPPLGKAVTYYHRTFILNEEMLTKGALFICFKAVDYEAEVYINGYPVGSHEGFFAPFEFDFSDVARTGENTILVVVKNDFIARKNENDQGMKYGGDKIYGATNLGYDDPQSGWHHGPPGMGIYQDVFVEARPAVHIRDIFVRPMLDLQSAEAWIEVYNSAMEDQFIHLDLSCYGQNFPDTVFENRVYVPETIVVPGSGDLDKPEDHQRLTLMMERGVNYLKIPLDIPDPRLWTSDHPWLYQLQVKLSDQDQYMTDVQSRQFGMRSFVMDTTQSIKGKLYLNSKEIRLRGANTMGHLQQCVFRRDWDQLTDDILLAKICHMNFLRLTQRPVQPEVYETCDRLGMMTQTDLPLFGVLRRNKVAEAIKQAGEMERLVRAHPCNIMVSYINERFPNGEGSPHRHLSTPQEYMHFFNAADHVIYLANPDRVIKAGDGDYDPPSPGLPDNHCYNGWYNGHGLPLGKLHKGYWQWIKPGWYYGCGEFGAEGLDPLNTMEKYYPRQWLPLDTEPESEWNPGRISKSQTRDFHYMWFNTPYTLNDWIESSQVHQERVIRYMTEAFRRDSRMVSFAVHLFIDAWPAGWMKVIMDVDRQPKKSYFAYRSALEPLLVNLRTDRRTFYSGEEMKIEAWVCNDRNEAPAGSWLQYQLEREGRVLSSGKSKAHIPINSSSFQGFITWNAPKVSKRADLTLRLGLFDDKGTPLNQTTIELEVFPQTGVKESHKMAYVAGADGGLAKSIAGEFKMEVTGNLKDADVILIDEYHKFLNNREAILDAVEKGKVALFLKLSPGEYDIAGTKVEISKCTMGSYFFVSPASGHPMVKDFKPMDFSYWYDRDRDYIASIIDETFQADLWTPILTSGNVIWGRGGAPALAVAEYRYGEGFLRICQLDLAGKTEDNPVAGIFVERIMDTK